MNQVRKEANWSAICQGRDLLKEVDDLEKNAERLYDRKLRNKIAAEIKDNTVDRLRYPE